MPNDEMIAQARPTAMREIEINDVASESAVELACAYLRRGWKPVPVPYRQKAPTIQDWQNLEITEDNVGDYFDDGRQNIGVQMGAHSAGLTDVDLDCPESLALAETVLPSTAAIFGRDSNPGSHRLYITGLHASEQKATIQFAEPTALSGGGRVMLAELRIGGNDSGVQTIFPGSRHPSGEAVRWESDGEPATVNGLDLKKQVALLAAGALLVRHYPSEGQRHEAALVLGGMLARRPGTTADQINEFVMAIARAAGDEQIEDRGRVAAGAVQLFANGEPTPGLPRMREVWGAEVTDTVAKWLDIGGDPIGRGRPAHADSQTGRLIALAGSANLVHSPEGTSYADVVVNGHRETLPVSPRAPDSGFGAWLRHRFFEETGSAPNSEALRAALNTLAAQARYSGQRHDVHVRVAHVGDKIYFDLGDKDWRVIVRSTGEDGDWPKTRRRGSCADAACYPYLCRCRWPMQK